MSEDCALGLILTIPKRDVVVVSLLLKISVTSQKVEGIL